MTDYKRFLFEDSEEFNKVLAQLPEQEREKTKKALEEFAEQFYTKFIAPLEKL